MSLTADEFEQYFRENEGNGDPLGDALAALAVAVETDAVADIRELRERT